MRRHWRNRGFRRLRTRLVAITAVMRRIIILANTLLREGRDWQPKRP
ncbi:hypothetical protein [Gluconobacter oxydans]|nr:hypothetical protein [Gluconobacter oxydans]